MLLRLAILLLAVLLGQPAFAERKAALLIGNATYAAPATVLKNPPNDIIAMKATFEGAGFDVTVLQNAGRAAMSAALATFEQKVAGADIGLIYYSGHGIEVNGDNFLIPVDAKLASDRDVKYETILLDDLLHALAGATKLKLVLLDACRDNPFLTSMKRLSTRGIPTRGLARADTAESNMLIGYATGPGEVALDGDGAMSPYATALARHLVTPGLEIEAALRAVAKDVFDATGGKQRPFKTGSLFETVMLGEGFAPDASGAVGNNDPCRDAAAHWAEIREGKNKAMFEDHVRLFPTCAFANIARQRMADLAPVVTVREATGETECDRLAAAENDPFKLASTKGVDFYKIDSARAIPACQDAMRENPQEKRFFYQLGRSLDQAGRFAEALAEYRKAADLGNHQAMRNLAILYENGEGTAQDYVEAMRWFRKSADLGNGLAMNNVGLFYRNGKGVPEDFALAQEWYRKSADAGIPVAMQNIGDLFDLGLGTAQDFKQSLAWYEKAAAAGHAPAMTNVGWAYEMGRGVERDDTEAMRWYQKAAAGGDAQAMNNIGLFYEHGRATKRNYAEAMRWFRRAADTGHAGAMTNIGWAFDAAHGVKRDDKQALEWYRKAADGGDAQAMNNLGTFYQNGRAVKKDEKEALRWYLKAAEKNNSYGAHNLAALLEQSEPAEAGRWMETALRLGHADSLQQMQENSREWSLSFRKELQQRLSNAGVYSGDVDGRFGPSTIEAIQAVFGKG
ncbi:SEL1-like repeat protein [Shinella sp. CPCC 100929]|uniref:SEL1-like repeat protein n=1 Tax=Shinella lacus TaxID=2654216 RepID=A0ABT1R1U4_9HYPH|nr:caspase family protein [Shinella lacus]MCQ4629096.1 SEL1-like repeat protein [Shinella lacus]